MRTSKIVLSALAFSLTAATSVAQDAKKILDDLSKKYKACNTIHAKFSYHLDDPKANMKVTQQGEVKIKGQSFNLVLGDNHVISDGTNVWIHNKETNTVTIELLEDVAQDGMSPSEMFRIWEKDFKHEYVKELKDGTVNLLQINLFPLKPKDKPYHTIQLFVNKDKNEVHKMVVKGREGNDFIYTIKSFESNKPFPDSDFKFTPSKVPGAEIIDNRI
jgi:outer membrane lipoprotein carrier protein